MTQPIRWAGLSLLAASLSFAATPAEQSFEKLKALVGTWEAPVGAEGKKVRASYRLVSNDSTLVETWTTPSGKETVTIFHLDGKRLLATHYCAQGNQPRLAAKGSTLVFELVDVTNLSSPKASHLHRLELKLGEGSSFEKTETYRENGKDEVTRLEFTRLSP